MSEYETESEGQIITMVPQLGTTPRIMANAEWDMRLLSYIVAPEKIPSSFRPVFYAKIREDIVIHRKRAWTAITDNYLTLVNSIEGRGRNDQIRAENALKGIPVHIEQAPEKPGILDRIMDRESVQKYERWKERQEMGLE